MVREWILYCDFCFAFHDILLNVFYWNCRYQLIEDKLKLSKYLSWTFCSIALGIIHNLSLYAFVSIIFRLDYDIIYILMDQKNLSLEGQNIHSNYYVTQTLYIVDTFLLCFRKEETGYWILWGSCEASWSWSSILYFHRWQVSNISIHQIIYENQAMISLTIYQ